MGGGLVGSSEVTRNPASLEAADIVVSSVRWTSV